MNAEFSKQKFKIEKTFDKIEVNFVYIELNINSFFQLSINEIVFDITMNLGYDSKEIKKLNLHKKLKDSMNKITNFLIQSYLSKTIQSSIY